LAGVIVKSDSPAQLVGRPWGSLLLQGKIKIKSQANLIDRIVWALAGIVLMFINRC
jgi:hypothetical protein